MKKLVEKWAGYITPKRMSGIVTVFYILTLIPMLIIAKYNFPSADVFAVGDTCRIAWMSSHSLWQVLKSS